MTKISPSFIMPMTNHFLYYNKYLMSCSLNLKIKQKYFCSDQSQLKQFYSRTSLSQPAGMTEQGSTAVKRTMCCFM